MVFLGAEPACLGTSTFKSAGFGVFGGPIQIGVFNATTGASSSSSLMVRTSHPNFTLVLVKQFWKRRLLRRDNRAPGELQSRYRACPRALPSQAGILGGLVACEGCVCRAAAPWQHNVPCTRSQRSRQGRAWKLCKTHLEMISAVWPNIN